jgi:hypothetical protein
MNNTLYVAAASGGLWKTTNKGSSWTPLTDQLPSLATTVIVLDPTNTQHVYVGTGDPTQSNSGYGANSYFGEGILFSGNGGTTWSILGDDPAHFQGKAIFDMAIDATGTVLYIAASNGFWLGTQSAGVWTFTQKGTGGPWTSVGINLGNPDVINVGSAGGAWVYRAAAGTLVTSAMCLTTTDCTTPTPRNQVGRTTVAEDPVVANAKYVYASFECLSACPVTGAAWWGLYESTDYGSTFHPLVRPGAPGFEFSQTSYDLSVGVDPLNDNYVYFGLVDLFAYSYLSSIAVNISSPSDASLVACNAWNTTRFTLQSGIHCDQHGISFDKAGTLYTATDGGPFSSPPNSRGGQWTDLNSNLYISQFYPGTSYNTNNPNRFIGGTQDNGTETWNGTGWQMSAPGDGGFSAIDTADPTNTWYSTYPFLNLKKTTNGSTLWSSSGGPTWTLMTSGMTLDPTDSSRVKGALFIAPFTMDPNNHSNLLAGADRPYLTQNGATSWQDISGNFAPITAARQGISATTICPTAGTFYLGTSDGRAFATTTGFSMPPAWTEVSAGLPGQWVTRLNCDASGTVYLTIGGSQTTAGTHVFQKASGATSWTSIQGDLPNTTVTSLTIDPRTTPAIFYVSTDLGVYQSVNGGTNWVPLGTGMPQVPVVDLVLDTNRAVLFGATHGRGLWQIAVASAPGAPTSVSATAGDASATVSFTAPASNGGSAITGYQLTPYVGTTAQTPTTFNSPATTETLSGLTNGTTYTVKVAAINAVGMGPDSASSNAFTPMVAYVVGVVGTDGGLWTLTNGSSTFTSLGGGLLGAPAVISIPQPSGHGIPLYIATGTDHNLYVRNDTKGWQPLTNSAIYCKDNPAGIVNGGTLTLACTGSDNALYDAETPVPAGTNLPSISASAWHSLGGASLYGPAVGVVGGVVTFGVVGTDQAAYFRTLTTPYVKQDGWACTGHLALASVSTTAYFACHGYSDNALYYSTNTGGGWGAPVSLGGVLIGGPGIAATSAGPTIFVEGSDGALYQRSPTTGFTRVGGKLQFGAAATGL